MKGLLKFITCGSVDDGKSTLIGHILYDAKLIYADQEKALELDSKVGSRNGDIDYSLLLDGLMAEREQGITIDVAYRYFTTDNRSFIVADTPGHEEYTRNMAVGASFADLAVILIDASQGVLVQTRRHARICKLMGIRHFVFAVNKMDLVKYSKSRFDEIVTLPSNEKAHVKQILMTDKNVETAFKGQPVTITLDKEVDVSRGCVITKDTNLASYQELTASILWMDDEQLTAGKDYLVKLGTKTISGIVSEIKYAVDVNTGEHIPADSLTKNGIAVCTILLAEPIAVDLFSKHKTLGELILIDRVSNMTSACGVVDSVEEKADDAKKASFVLGSLEARGDIFEEFFYDTSSLNVLKYQPVKETYTKGDTIPVEGESYKYPDSFDIIVLRDSVAVKVRDHKITDIVPTSEYSYGGVPVVNGRGFEVLADSNEKIQQFLSEYSNLKSINGADFFAKWVKFDTYRKIAIQNR